MNVLVDGGIIYKKRGLGMFVKEGAVEKIRQKRQSQFYEQYVSTLISEALKLLCDLKKDRFIYIRIYIQS